jgi:hypothetical protein
MNVKDLIDCLQAALKECTHPECPVYVIVNGKKEEIIQVGYDEKEIILNLESDFLVEFSGGKGLTATK